MKVKIITNEEIAAAIRWHRENLGIKSQDVASQMFISKSAYSKIEKGEKAITVVELCKIADIFNMSLDELIRIPSRRNRQ